MKSGLIVNAGGMFSGKTSALLQQAERYEVANKSVVFIKPKRDKRYAENYVVAHTGYRRRAMVVDECKRLNLNLLKNYDVIAVDEVQFFNKGIIEDIGTLLEMEKLVLVSGLDMDYEGNGFEIVMELMARADVVHKHKAICKCCHRDATFSLRISKSSERILIGEKEDYIPLCRECFRVYRLLNKKNKGKGE